MGGTPAEEHACQHEGYEPQGKDEHQIPPSTSSWTGDNTLQVGLRYHSKSFSRHRGHRSTISALSFVTSVTIGEPELITRSIAHFCRARFSFSRWARSAASVMTSSTAPHRSQESRVEYIVLNVLILGSPLLHRRDTCWDRPCSLPTAPDSSVPSSGTSRSRPSDKPGHPPRYRVHP